MKNKNEMSDQSDRRILLVPAYAAERAKLKGKGIKYRKVEAKCGDLVIEAALFGGDNDPAAAARNKTAARLMGLTRCADTAEVVLLGDRPVMLVAPDFGDVSIMRPNQPEKDGFEDVRRTAISAYTAMLRRFSRLVGKYVQLHGWNNCDIRAPLPDSSDTLHIFANAMPPGEVRVRMESHIFGLNIRADGAAVGCNGPTNGRGLILHDDDGKPVVQVLGSNIYLLLPVLTVFHAPISQIIFSKTLAAAWNGYRKLSAMKPDRSRLGRNAFVEKASVLVRDAETFLGRDLAAKEIEIQETLSRLVTLYRLKSEYETVIGGLHSAPQIAATLKRLPADFAAIRAEPDFAGMSFVDGGIHVVTKPIMIEHGLRRYPVGSCTVRISQYGAVSVWNEAPTHPNGVPHPHIAKDGGPCFGNASEAIARALGEQRYGDAVHLIFRWLRYGYTPELAAVKIEEWPSEHDATMPRPKDKTSAKAKETPPAIQDVEV